VKCNKTTVEGRPPEHLCTAKVKRKNRSLKRMRPDRASEEVHNFGSIASLDAPGNDTWTSTIFWYGPCDKFFDT
jgi:hypothetical protein